MESTVRDCGVSAAQRPLRERGRHGRLHGVERRCPRRKGLASVRRQDWAWPQVLDACHLTDAAPRCDHAVAMRTLPPRVVVFPMMSLAGLPGHPQALGPVLVRVAVSGEPI